MFFLASVLLIGLASAQKVTRLTSCTIDDKHLRMDCKYEPSAVSPAGTAPPLVLSCTYTQGDRTVDATDPDEASSQDTAFKKRAKARIIDGNNCQLRLDNMSDAKNNFTCSIKQSETASMTVVVDKKLLLPCSAWSLSLQTTCTGALLSLVFSTMLQQLQTARL